MNYFVADAAAVAEDVSDGLSNLGAYFLACYHSVGMNAGNDDHDHDSNCQTVQHVAAVVVAAAAAASIHVGERVVVVAQHAAHENRVGRYLRTNLNHYCFQDEVEPGGLVWH